MRSLLLGESASANDLRLIRSTIESARGVERLIHLRTQHLGPDELLVAAKVQFEPTYSMTDLAAAINRLEAAVRDAVPVAEPIYLEPDIWQD
jgi:divalent metal cation (Fe/Co/Zn/Cd) transporter